MSQRQRRGYEMPARLKLNRIDPGRNLLVTGEAIGGVRDVVLGIVLAGLNQQEGVIVVSTNSSATALRDDAEAMAGYLPPDRFGIVDCSGSGDPSDVEGDRSLSGPGDLTGIGIEFSSLYGEYFEGDVDRVRVGLYSISTLLVYNDLRTVFRFLHTVTGRIESVDGLGVFGIDPASHDEQAINTIEQLYDGRIEVRETDAGERQLRVRGLDEQPREWQSIR